MSSKNLAESHIKVTDTEQLPMEVDKDAAPLRAQAQANTDIEHSMSLRDAVRFYPKSVLYCVILSMAIIMEGYQVGLVPSLFAQPAFQRKYGRERSDGSFQLDNRYQSALTAAVQAGSIFGYWLSGIVIERIGYKKTMQGSLLSVTCFIFIIFFAPSVVILVVGEGLLGIPWGIIQTLTTTYAAEVSPVALRAYVTSYVNLCWVIGGFVSTGVLRGTVYRTDEWAYRIPFALQWMWPIPIIIGVSFAPERYDHGLVFGEHIADQLLQPVVACPQEQGRRGTQGAPEFDIEEEHRLRRRQCAGYDPSYYRPGSAR